jgi:hypothetical protein
VAPPRSNELVGRDPILVEIHPRSNELVGRDPILVEIHRRLYGDQPPDRLAHMMHPRLAY